MPGTCKTNSNYTSFVYYYSFSLSPGSYYNPNGKKGIIAHKLTTRTVYFTHHFNYTKWCSRQPASSAKAATTQNHTIRNVGVQTLSGFSLRYGGSPSIISIAITPRLHMSTFGPYCFLQYKHIPILNQIN